MSNLWNKIKQYSDDAPKAGFVNVNFGKLIVTPMVVSWSEIDGVRSVLKRPMVEDEELSTSQQLELAFKVMISELNPSLTFEYERNVAIRNSGAQKSDWAEITRPSLEKVFSKNWAEVIEKQPYVSVEDTPNVAGTASSSGKIYGVPKFTAKFENKAACEAARDIRYKKHEAVEEKASSVPTAEAIEKTKSLIGSVGDEKARKMLDKKPFGAYDPDDLFALAKNS